MAVTRINNNQITSAQAGNAYLGINAASKVQSYTITGGLLANSLTYGSDLTVTGNLTVQGTTTAVNTVNTVIQDPLLVLADGQTTGTPTVDIGFVGLRGNLNSAVMAWKESATQFVAALSNTDVGGTGLSNTTFNINSYADFKANTITANANLNVTGTTSLAGNITSALQVTGNISGGNILTPGQISATGNITASTSAFFIGNGSLLTGVAASTAGFPVTSGTTNINAISSGNIFASVAGTANVFTIASTGIYTSGLSSVSGNITGGNLLSAGLTSTTGNATHGNILTAGLISATGNISGANINPTGNIIPTANATYTLGSATAQWKSLYVSGNTIYMGNLQLQNSTANTLNVAAADGTTPAQINMGIISASGNITGANISTGGLVSATANITGGNVLTAGLVSATGTITATANIAGGNLLTGGLISATATVTGGNLATGGTASATGNVTGGNVLTAGLVSATANVTGGNLLTGGQASAAGNVTAANYLTAGLVSAAGNVIGASLVTANRIYSASTMTITNGAGNITIAPTGNVVLNNNYINGIQLNPVQDQDVASKYYVDTMVSTQLTYHQPVYATTIANSAVTTGGTTTYTQPNGVSNGVGAYIQTTGSWNLVDTANVQTANTRILVKNEANAVWNGVYGWANATTIVRTTDTDSYGPNNTTDLSLNDYFFTTNGNVNAGSAFVVDSPSGTITFGTSNISFALFSSSQTYQAGNGISISGTVISARVDNTTTAFDGSQNIIVKASAQLTTPNIGAATGTSLSATANVTGGNLLTGGLISSTGTITATANIAGGNLTTAGQVSATANITGGNVLTGGQISATGNITASTSSYFIGNGSLLTGVAATSAGFPITSGTSNIAAIGSGNILVTVANVANIVTFANTGVYTSGVASATGNITGGNLLTAGLASVTGNVTGGNITTAGQVTATANITGGNVLTGGLISATATVTGGNLATGGTASATGNVTGGNVLTGGLISATATVTGGNLATGGTASATGNITGGNVLTGGLISSTGTITATANIAGGNLTTAGQVTATANITGGNILTAGIISTSGNIYGANLIVSSIESVTGNVTGGNLLTGGLVSATGTITATANITGGNILTAGLVSATANVTGGNLTTGGQVVATANVTGGNILTAGLVSATGNVYGGNIVLTGNSVNQLAAGGTITVNGALANTNFAVSGQTANVFFVSGSTNTASFGSNAQTTNAIVAFNATNSIVVPVGNTAQRPATGVTGMFRWNTTLSQVEIYNGTAWANVGAPIFTVIASEAFTGNGVATTFTLSSSQTTNSCMVSINGITQLPTTAYAVSGTTLTFTEAPQIGDQIEVREFTTTTSVTSLANGNTSITLDGTNINVTGNFNPTGNGTANIGNATNTFNTVFAKATTAQYADLAENYVGDAVYEPGTVVDFGGEFEVTISGTDMSSAVAGVVSTNPGFIMNEGLESANAVAVAFTGRVPCKVTGYVHKGDLMVSNGDGTARSESNPAAGSVIGKALADFEGETGVIEVVVGRF